MKKLLSLFLVLGLALFIFSPVLASDTSSMKVYTIVKTTGNGATLVPITTIVPGKSRILGWDMGPTVTSAGSTAASIHDVAAAASLSTSNQFGELVCANTTSIEKWYPRPIDVTAGIVVGQGTGTVVNIYYENTIPL
jgi:hypothetical protein